MCNRSPLKFQLVLQYLLILNEWKTEWERKALKKRKAVNDDNGIDCILQYVIAASQDLSASSEKKKEPEQRSLCREWLRAGRSESW